MKTEQQRYWIRKWLESGRKLTSLDAFYEFGTLRLSGHIHALRKQGMEIVSKPVEVNGKQIAEYSAKL